MCAHLRKNAREERITSALIVPEREGICSFRSANNSESSSQTLPYRLLPAKLTCVTLIQQPPPTLQFLQFCGIEGPNQVALQIAVCLDLFVTQWCYFSPSFAPRFEGWVLCQHLAAQCFSSGSSCTPWDPFFPQYPMLIIGDFCDLRFSSICQFVLQSLVF